jgi:hypothetical protein
MRRFRIVSLLTAAATLFGVPATASPYQQSPAAAPVFAAPAVGDAELALVRGGFPGPERRYLASLTEVQARDDFRWSASLGILTFDNWFNDVGNPLIFAAQR